MTGLALSSAVLAAEWDGHMGRGGGRMWLWGTLMIVFFIAVIGLIVWLIARGPHSHAPTAPAASAPTDHARAILAERLARGEIDPEEYQERLRHLS